MAEIIGVLFMIVTTFSQMFKCAWKPHLIITLKTKMPFWNAIQKSKTC